MQQPRQQPQQRRFKDAVTSHASSIKDTGFLDGILMDLQVEVWEKAAEIGGKYVYYGGTQADDRAGMSSVARLARFCSEARAVGRTANPAVLRSMNIQLERDKQGTTSANQLVLIFVNLFCIGAPDEEKLSNVPRPALSKTAFRCYLANYRRL
jgi:hypothetical protein